MLKQRNLLRLFKILIPICLIIGSGLWGWTGSAGSLNGSIEVMDYGVSQVNSDSLPLSLAYDSGWYDLASRPDPIPVPFTHNVGGNPDDYLVRLMCADDTDLGIYDCTDYGFNPDALWYGLTDTSILVWVMSGTQPDAVRVQIYSVSPDYDSGWYPLLSRPDPIPVPFSHNVGGDQDHYLVSLTCRDETSLEIYNCTDFNFTNNAQWYGLTESAITIWVDDGPRPDEIRVRIIDEPPDYDSGWINLATRPDPIPVLMDHRLGGSLQDYLVSLTCRDDSELSTFGCKNFLFNTTSGWYGLDTEQIVAWVEGGSLPDDVRVRIWAPDHVYLPVVTRN